MTEEVKAIVVGTSGERQGEVVDDQPGPEVGSWYWLTHRSGYSEDASMTRSLTCVVHVGSNFARLRDPHGSQWDVHFNGFWDVCEPEPDPDSRIGSMVEKHQRESARLMSEVQGVVARLHVGNQAGLPGAEVRSLAVANASGRPMDDYKSALTKAREDDLPGLFKQIERENKSLSSWMKARLIPFKAKAEAMRSVMGRVEDRIFSVELYAGLSEQVVRVRDGEPAPVVEKVRLMQRRCYMDEECLARYEAGGMDITGIGGFDEWLARDDNFSRVLPFPRCVVAFRVRRHAMEREAVNVSDFVRISEIEKADKSTFLYVRNGGQLFRIRTEIEFDEDLFPDMGATVVDRGKLWISKSSFNRKKVISDNEYQEIAEREAKQRAERDAAPEKERWHHHVSHDAQDYVPFNPDTTEYDAGVEMMEAEAKRHNRMVIVLQGLLDRSPVFHPHPPWSLWSRDGFQAALELVYDSSRALAPSVKPDFEAYRARLNASLAKGSVTVGQEDSWELREGAKESARYDRAGVRSDYRPTRSRPYGDPGPGVLARVARRKKSGECVYEWQRKRQTYSRWDEGPVAESISVRPSKLLNADAYRPGDYRQFYDDPRTREEYLKWAPLLLVAEDYHAGKRKVGPEEK